MNAEPSHNEPTVAETGPAGPATNEVQQPPATPRAEPQPMVATNPTGQRRAGVEDPRRKSTVLAVILSAMPGLGQIYVGYYPRGFTHAFVVAGLIAVLSSMNDFSPLFPMLMILLFFFWLYNMIDAGRRAAMYNLLLEGGEVVDLPDDIRMPGLRGSIVGGIVIVVIGGITLSHTAYDVPLDWLENWWPAGVVIFGVYLVAKGMMERAWSVQD